MKRLTTLFMLLAMLLVPTPPQAKAADSWQALPGNTLVAIRIPSGKAIYDALTKNTKLGKVMFNEERIATMKKLMEEGDPAQWDRMQKDLAKFDLSVDDFPTLWSGETGFAVAMHKARPTDKGPRVFMLAWANPGEKLAAKLMNAMETALADNKDAKHKRFDFEIGGQKITHYAIPEFGMPPMADFPADFENMTPEEIQEFFKKRAEARRNAKMEQIDQTNVLISRQGGRILMAIGPPQNRQAVQAAKAAGGNIDWSKITGVEDLTAGYARFLADHVAGGGEFIGKTGSVRGLNEALPKGVPMFEVMGNLKPLMALAEKKEPMVGNILKGLGLDKTGAFAMRFALDGNQMRTGMFAEAPAPRTGIFTVLDQAKLPAGVPAWVPANAMDYSHIGLDLGEVYKKIKEIVIAQMGQEAAQGFNMVEFQVKNFAQADLATVLSSIGKRHSIVSYVPKLDGPIDQADPSEMSRAAFVWQLKNEQVWTNLFNTIGAFAGQNAKKVEEQGFTGYRMNGAPMEMGLFKGKGFLVMAMGQGVSEEILSALANPPKGDAALRNTAGYQKARKMLPPKDGMLYQYGDMGKYTAIIFKAMMESMRAEMPRNQPNLTKLMEKLMPSNKELDGVFGVGGGHALFNEHGFVAESVVELPSE